MVKLIKWTIPMLLIGNMASAAVIESDASITKELHDTKLLNALVSVVKASGYRCGSISGAVPFLFSKGIRLTCNHNDYVYNISDKGGRLIVELE